MPENSEILALIGEQDFLEEPIEIELTEEKPFNKCLFCEYLGHSCSGPNLTAMTLGRACEFLQLRRLQLKKSYQKTADEADLAVITVKRILTGKIKDPSFLSMQSLSRALIADPKGKYPCAMHLVSKSSQMALDECKTAQEELARKDKELADEKAKVAFLKGQVEFKENQMLEKDKQIVSKDKRLEERRDFIYRKDRIIGILGVALAICLLVIIGALIIDSMNPNLGFFWRSEVISAFFGGTSTAHDGLSAFAASQI